MSSYQNWRSTWPWSTPFNPTKTSGCHSAAALFAPCISCHSCHLLWWSPSSQANSTSSDQTFSRVVNLLSWCWRIRLEPPSYQLWLAWNTSICLQSVYRLQAYLRSNRHRLKFDQTTKILFNKVSYLSCFERIFGSRVFGWNYRARTTLNHWLHKCIGLLEEQFDPFGCIHVEHQHVLAHHSVLSLTSVHDHWALIHDGWVILSRADWNSFGLHDLDVALLKIILQNLVGALAQLSLTVELEASAENIQFLIVTDRCVALAALNLLLWREIHFFPLDIVTHNSSFYDLLDWLLVHASNHVATIPGWGHSSRLTWWWDPLLTWRLDMDLSPEPFSFLHPLDEWLNTSCKFLSQFISGDVVSWCRYEGTSCIILLNFRLNIQ